MQDQLSLEERASYLRALIEHAPDPLRKEFSRRMEISWLYHDNALEGLVLSPDEIGAAIDGQVPEEPSLANLFDEIRQHKAAIERVREWAKAKGAALDIDFLRELYAILAPEEVEGKKPPPFRKEALIQRLYFHEIESPEKIPARLKAFFQWVNSEETRRSTHVVRLAAKAHFQLLHIFPFPRHNGRIARLIMNAFLLDAGFPPAVIHSTERQRYYESLRLSDNALAQLVKEALSTSIESSIRFLESRMPGALVSKVQSIAHRKSAPTDEAIFEKDSEAEEADAVDASRTSGRKTKSAKATTKTTKAAKQSKSVATSNQQTDGNGKASKKQAATSKTPTLASTSTSKSKNSSETNSTKSKVSKKQIPSDSASELGSKPQLQKTGKSK